ncbi:hypothetical protein J3Q64DRAFT_1679338 [Phycomyces blakesleeanus]|uniref:C3H1-type domain-containing protein n=2 Tax=Phycomyces blakesleeanus TaxID=4837 RepID=A0ABR3AXP4_PHYBL
MSSDAEILARIAQLTGAIKQHHATQGTGRGSSSYRGPSNQGWRGRGNMTISAFPHRSSPYTVHKPYTPPTTSFGTNKSLTLNKPSDSYNPPTTSFGGNKSLTLNKAPNPYTPPTPYSGNKSLVLNKQQSTPAPYTPSSKFSVNKSLVLNRPSTPPVSASTSLPTPAPIKSTVPKRVTMDGVNFIVKGKKLVREDVLKTTSAKPSRPSKILKIRKPLRTKKGHMVFFRKPEGYVREGNSLVLKTKTRQNRYCGIYTRYGKCPRGNHCAFKHDRSRRAICPRFVKQQCSKTEQNCLLSHTPTANNMPHCLYFQRGRCKNESCIFPHVSVSPDAPVCKLFALEGYCPKGLECHSKHVHVCPEFAETAKCSNANCRLPHVAQSTSKDKHAKGGGSRKASGVLRPGQWMSNDYFHTQRKKKAEQRKMEGSNNSSKEAEPEIQSEEQQRPEEDEGYVPLFDDEDDDDGAWFQKLNDNEAPESLRFSDREESESEDEDEDGTDDELESGSEEGIEAEYMEEDDELDTVENPDNEIEEGEFEEYEYEVEDEDKHEDEDEDIAIDDNTQFEDSVEHVDQGNESDESDDDSLFVDAESDLGTMTL